MATPASCGSVVAAATAAELAIIEFVDFEPSRSRAGQASGKGKPSLMDRAKGMFGGGRGKAEAADESDEAEAAPIEAGEEHEESSDRA